MKTVHRYTRIISARQVVDKFTISHSFVVTEITITYEVLTVTQMFYRTLKINDNAGKAQGYLEQVRRRKATWDSNGMSATFARADMGKSGYFNMANH